MFFFLFFFPGGNGTWSTKSSKPNKVISSRATFTEQSFLLPARKHNSLENECCWNVCVRVFVSVRAFDACAWACTYICHVSWCRTAGMHGTEFVCIVLIMRFTQRITTSELASISQEHEPDQCDRISVSHRPGENYLG